jgi:hypothetical protein
MLRGWVAIFSGALVSCAGVAHADELPSPDGEPRTDVALIHSLAVMTVMRSAEAVLYPDPFAEVDPVFWAEHYHEAISRRPKWDSTQAPFEWDGDPWPINAIGHPIFGSELYFRARVCHHDVLSSLAFATGTSAIWEYGFEANGVRPSGLDLWFTPLSGAVLGELRHVGWRAADSIGNAPLRGVLRFVLDPLGTLERAVGAPC